MFELFVLHAGPCQLPDGILELTLIIFLLCESAGSCLRDTRSETQGVLLAVIGLIVCIIEGRLAVLAWQGLVICLGHVTC